MVVINLDGNSRINEIMDQIKELLNTTQMQYVASSDCVYSVSFEFVQSPKCTKCDDNRVIRTGQVATSSYKVCDCAKYVKHYICEQHPVGTIYNIGEKGVTVITSNGIEYMIPDGRIFNSVSDAVSSNAGDKDVWFMLKEDCLRYCSILNGEHT